MSYFVKLPLDYFDGLAVKKLRKMDNGNELLIVYLKIVLLGVETGGVILHQGVFNTIEEEIAIEISEELNSVSEVVQYCKSNKLAEEVRDEDATGYRFFESISLTESKGESTERVRRHREKMKMLRSVTETPCNVTETPSSTYLYNTSNITDRIGYIDSQKEEDCKGEPVSRFIQPTVEEVKQYIKEKGYHFKAEDFISACDAKEWHTPSGAMMEDWKAACDIYELQPGILM